jgi:2-polyprenyl-6-methoxyphenol hydroxylase-like FAD-dependent oxidoreductase
MAGTRYDVVIVGARCAGATLATLLARGEWRVLLIDRDRFPSDTVSTHLLFPNTLSRLEELGVMAQLRSTHEVPLLRFVWRVLGHEVGGTFTPVGGYDRCSCIRRETLDAALVERAIDAGAVPRFSATVTDVIGRGTADDPVRGVVLDTGEAITARWVVGADGRTSTVARRLGVPKERELRGEMAMLFGYWKGLPASDSLCIDVREHTVLQSTPCEDGLHMLVVGGRSSLTRGSRAELDARYREQLRRFPAVLNPRLLAHAELVSRLIVAPETMMRGHYRCANGPGWVLVGDAGVYEHPATAQGMSDAVEQAWYVADALLGGEDLRGYRQWRDDHTEEHYAWSFRAARFPGALTSATYSGLAADPAAGQQFLDLFTRRARPSDLFTAERRSRWSAAWAYEDGRYRVSSLLEEVSHRAADLRVPACPSWTIRDLLAHLVGVAEDVVHGTLLAEVADAWRSAARAEARDRWTARHVARYADRDIVQLLHEWIGWGQELETALRRGEGFAEHAPPWMFTAPAADLAVHLHDLRGTLRRPGDRDAPVTRLGFAVYRDWLGSRVTQSGLPALRLSDGTDDWVLGHGDAHATLTASRFELFRTISGRRSAARIRALGWTGDPEPYLPIISPYPLPTEGVDAPERHADDTLAPR